MNNLETINILKPGGMRRPDLYADIAVPVLQVPAGPCSYVGQPASGGGHDDQLPLGPFTTGLLPPAYPATRFFLKICFLRFQLERKSASQAKIF